MQPKLGAMSFSDLHAYEREMLVPNTNRPAACTAMVTLSRCCPCGMSVAAIDSPCAKPAAVLRDGQDRAAAAKPVVAAAVVHMPDADEAQRAGAHDARLACDIHVTPAAMAAVDDWHPRRLMMSYQRLSTRTSIGLLQGCGTMTDVLGEGRLMPRSQHAINGVQLRMPCPLQHRKSCCWTLLVAAEKAGPQTGNSGSTAVSHIALLIGPIAASANDLPIADIDTPAPYDNLSTLMLKRATAYEQQSRRRRIHKSGSPDRDLLPLERALCLRADVPSRHGDIVR